MGQKYFLPHLWKQDEPNTWQPIQYDPAFGFDEPRKPKVMEATEQMMDSANLPEPIRDHCAMQRIYYHQCVVRSAPMWTKCEHLRHKVTDCVEEELLHDMKEFEREKRLNARERRIAAKRGTSE